MVDLEGAREPLNLHEQRGGMVFKLLQGANYYHDSLAELDPRDATIAVYQITLDTSKPSEAIAQPLTYSLCTPDSLELQNVRNETA